MLQEKTRTTKEELVGRHQARPQEHVLDLGGGQGTGKWQSKMASTRGPMQPSGCGM